jgi:rhamnosyltransferase
MSSAAPPKVTLLVPTFNAGPEFPEILGAMMDQDLEGELEVLVIDSGSTDGTAELLRSRPVRLIEIPNHEFNHGSTRNLGIREASGEIVVLAVQDARPHDRRWMQRLLACFDDPRVAGAYSCQLPRSDANPFIKERLRNWVASQVEPRVQEVASREEFEALEPLERLQRVAFDNVSSAVRRSVALEIPFRKRRFGEDLDWGYRAVLSGHKVVFEPRSKVVHSHNSSIWYEFKRVYLDHQNLHRLLGVHTVPRWKNVVASTRWAVPHLLKVVREDPDLGRLGRLKWRAKAFPYAFSQNLAQYLGAWSTSRLEQGDAVFRRIDGLLRQGV